MSMNYNIFYLVWDLTQKWRYDSNIYTRYSIDYIWSTFVFERYVYAPRIHTYDIRRRYIMYQLILYGLMFNSLQI